MNRDAAIWAGIAAAAVAMVLGFIAVDNAAIRKRLRALEAVQHLHRAGGAPMYPPHWRSR